MSNQIHSFAALKTWYKHIVLLVIFGLGVFLIPGFTYACSKKAMTAEQPSCSMKQDKTPLDKDFKKAKSCEKGDNQNDCSKECRHGSCSCSITSSPFSVLSPTEILTNLFSEVTRQKFAFNKTHYSSGFLTIWLPPKIS